MPEKTIYKIAKWRETFETADSRRFRSLPWISMPTNLGSNGCQMLADAHQDGAAEVYGIWCILVAIASQAPERGVLATSRGVPYTFDRLAALSQGMASADQFERLFEWASKAEIGWLETWDGIPDQSSPGQHPDSNQSGQQTPPSRHPVDTQSSPSRHLGNTQTTDLTDLTDLTDGRTDDGEKPPVAPVRAVRAVRPVDVGKVWEALRAKSKSIAGRVQPGHGKLSLANYELVVKTAAIAAAYPDLRDSIMAIVVQIEERTLRGEVIRRPWGYLKSELIRVCKAAGLNFDAQWKAITMPPTNQPSSKSAAKAEKNSPSAPPGDDNA